MLKLFRKEQGFTLIELIIVVVILGVLAAIGIPKFMNSRLEAWASSCRTNRASLDDAIERYKFDNSGLPSATNFQTTLVGNASASWIKTTFLCPATNTDKYAMDANGIVSCSNTVTSGASLTSKTHLAQ